MAEKIVKVVALNWYNREDYPGLLRIFCDANNLPPLYNDWLRRAEKGEKKMREDGIEVVRIVIHPDEFTAWCAANGQNIDAQARNSFAVWKLQKMRATRNN